MDGNERVGAMAAELFLGANGYDLDGSDDDLTELTLALASGEIPLRDYTWP